ncbi:MAG TPA: ribonuclease III, partial [Bacteroidales bacterium]|nr:ribonuclease III [Bacteroidales bacterium]
NIFLYKLAFRHRSIAEKQFNGLKLNNERLEFLGDAVLSSIIANYLFKRFPFKNEGELTQMRSNVVSRSHLNKLSSKLGFDKLVKCNGEGNMQPRWIMGNAFEAFVGALFLDKGYDFTAKIVINRILHMHTFIDELLASETNFKSKLLEWGQHSRKTIAFRVVEELGSRHKKQYVVEVLIDNMPAGQGMDFSIKGAEQCAASKALELLQENMNSSSGI